MAELLEYMEQTNEENAANDELREIYQMVDAVKKDEEVPRDYMKVTVFGKDWELMSIMKIYMQG